MHSVPVEDSFVPVDLDCCSLPELELPAVALPSAEP